MLYKVSGDLINMRHMYTLLYFSRNLLHVEKKNQIN